MRRPALCRLILGLSCILFALAAPVRGRQDEHPIDLAAARQCFDEARSDSDRDGGALWGIELYGPYLFADRATRFVVANQADAEGLLRPEAGVHIGTLPDSVNIANTAMRWGGVEWTMVAWPVPRDEGARRQLLAHEMFHRIQDDLGLGMSAAENTHLDERDGRLWMRLEWRALSAALGSEGEARRRAIEDALLFRAARRARYPDRADDERALELNEGLAEYTGIVVGRSSGADRFAAAIAALQRYDTHTNFVRSFAYASGPPYGLLIDQTMEGWTRSLTPGSDLGDLVARAYGIEPPAPGLVDESAARDRFAAYDGDAVLAGEDARHEAFVTQQAEFRARFIDGPRLILPMTGRTSYSFDPNGVKSLGDEGSVYLTARVVSDWGILEVTSGGALFATRGGEFIHIVVPAPGDPAVRPIVGDGYTLTLNEPWTLRRSGDGNALIAAHP